MTERLVGDDTIVQIYERMTKDGAPDEKTYHHDGSSVSIIRLTPYLMAQDAKTRKETLIEERNRIIDILIDQEYLGGTVLLPTRKPTHGNCCTCQDCGQGHDECVCYHNNLLSAILDVGKLKSGDIGG